MKGGCCWAFIFEHRGYKTNQSHRKHFSRQQIVDHNKEMATPCLRTCCDAVSCGPWLRRSRLFHVAVWTFVLWKVHVRILIFHCRKHILWDHKRGRDYVTIDFAVTVCDRLSHRNSSSDPSPPPSVCAASSSVCFQPPAAERKGETHTASDEEGRWWKRSVCLQEPSYSVQICSHRLLDLHRDACV